MRAEQAVVKSSVFIAVAVCLLVASQLWAVELTAHSNGKLIDQQSLPANYRLALDTLRNINGQWRSTQEQALTGKGTREVFEFARGADLVDIAGHYQLQLQQLGAAPLFACVAHKCGSSASWANEFFADRRLYGLDQYQRYSAYKLPGEKGDDIVVLYAVTRGNQRSYLVLDQFQSDRALTQTLSLDSLRTLLSDGQKVEIPILQSDQQWLIEDSFAQAVQRLIKIEPSTKLALVVYDHRSRSLDQNIERSRIIGEQLAQQLVAQSARKLRVEGIGDLIPRRNKAVVVWLMRYQ